MPHGLFSCSATRGGYSPLPYVYCSRPWPPPIFVRQPHKQLQHLGIIRRTEASHRVPSFHRFKPNRAASRVHPARDVVQHPRIRVQSWVDEPHRPLSRCYPLFIDPIDDAPKDRRAGRRSESVAKLALKNKRNVVSNGSHVRDPAADSVVDPAGASREGNDVRQGGERGVGTEAAVGGVGWTVSVKILLDGARLVFGNGVEITEAAAGREVEGIRLAGRGGRVHCCDFWRGDGAAWRDLRGANYGNVGTIVRPGWVENIVVWT